MKRTCQNRCLNECLCNRSCRHTGQRNQNAPRPVPYPIPSTTSLPNNTTDWGSLMMAPACDARCWRRVSHQSTRVLCWAGVSLTRGAVVTAQRVARSVRWGGRWWCSHRGPSTPWPAASKPPATRWPIVGMLSKACRRYPTKHCRLTPIR